MRRHHLLVLPNDLRAIERAVQDLMHCCQEAGFAGDRLRLNFRVGLTEALSNAMLYGNGRDPQKRVRVEAFCEPSTVTVKVTDEGRGFDPERLPHISCPPDRTSVGGRGIFLIRKLMDRVEFNERGNSITMVLLDREPYEDKVAAEP
jgi:serine/threonine-protein kinase RsbW